MKKLLLLVITLLSITPAYSKEYTEPDQKTIDFVFESYKTIHQYPELGKKEFKTSAFIKSELEKTGYKNFINIDTLPTSVIAVFDSGKPGKTIALRAELDARPNQEKTNLSYSSKINGVMHSCGHDAHASILLGTAKYVMDYKDFFTGKIIFVFQPAEEIKGGADDIVNSGILKKLGVEKIFALHVASGLPVGNISISDGYTMAGSNYFTLKIKGKGSHAAFPFTGDDLLLKSMNISEELSYLPARKFDISNRPVIISITYFSGGNKNASNIIPSEVEIKGTIRAYEDITKPYKDEKSIEETIKNFLDSQTKNSALSYELKITKGAPPTHNDEKLFSEVTEKLKPIWKDKLDTSTSKSMAAEDFAYYTETIPSLYFNLGIAKDNLGYEGIHTDTFTVNPEAFRYGLKLMTFLAESESE